MKKTLFIAILLLSLIVTAYADTATANSSMVVSAYKNPVIPELDYSITVSYQGNEEISGITKIFDVSDKIAKSKLVGNAFQIVISSNLKASIPVELVFTPFINQNDVQDTIPITYSFTNSVPNSYTQGENIVDGTQYSYTSRLRTYKSTAYYYRYKPALSLVNESGTTITSLTVEESGTKAYLTHSIASPYGYRKVYGNDTAWKTTTTMPTTTSSILPGFATGQTLTTTSYFKLSITNEDYENMIPNVDYIATVSLYITVV